MSCVIHNIGAQVWIESGIQIVNESTRKASRTERRIEGTVKDIDRNKHKVTVYVPELRESIIIDAADAKKK